MRLTIDLKVATSRCHILRNESKFLNLLFVIHLPFSGFIQYIRQLIFVCDKNNSKCNNYM